MKNSLFIPNILPSEHVFGHLARTILLNGVIDKHNVQSTLSGESRALIAKPTYQPFMGPLVNELAEHFELEVESIYLKHSMLGFYRHPMDCGKLTQVLQNKIRKDIYSPGAISFNTAKWRFCTDCISQDRDQYGTAYWHVEHQLPTALTCHVHENVLLLSECDNCESDIKDLREHPVPVSRCKKCDGIHLSKKMELNSTQKWIQDAGLELFRDDSTFVDSQYKYAVTYELPYRFRYMHGVNGRNNIFVCEEVQKIFYSWLMDHQLDLFFSNEIAIESLKAARIDRISFYPLAAPIVLHILWLRFLGAQSIKEAFCDVSSANVA